MGCKALRIRKSTRLSRHSHLHIDAAAVHEARSGLVVLYVSGIIAVCVSPDRVPHNVQRESWIGGAFLSVS